MSEVDLLKTELSRLEKERDVLKLTKQCYQAVARLKQVFALDLKTGRMLTFEILVEKPRPKK